MTMNRGAPGEQPGGGSGKPPGPNSCRIASASVSPRYACTITSGGAVYGAGGNAASNAATRRLRSPAMLSLQPADPLFQLDGLERAALGFQDGGQAGGFLRGEVAGAHGGDDGGYGGGQVGGGVDGRQAELHGPAPAHGPAAGQEQLGCAARPRVDDRRMLVCTPRQVARILHCWAIISPGATQYLDAAQSPPSAEQACYNDLASSNVEPGPATSRNSRAKLTKGPTTAVWSGR